MPAAILYQPRSFRLAPGHQLVVAVDTLVEAVHFSAGAEPTALGHKALAVNLSDLAAMGAEPLATALELRLPQPTAEWETLFMRGFSRLAERHGVEILAVNTTTGALCISVSIHGQLPRGSALLRSGARPGDQIFTTGTLGDAALVLACRAGTRFLPETALAALAPRLDTPTPRVETGLALRGIANSAIDISDGLAADLGHILTASGVGATLALEELPGSTVLRAALSPEEARRLALAGGDDYELCFTVPEKDLARLERVSASLPCAIRRIGRITGDLGLRCVDARGLTVTPPSGYDHFP